MQRSINTCFSMFLKIKSSTFKGKHFPAADKTIKINFNETKQSDIMNTKKNQKKKKNRKPKLSQIACCECLNPFFFF